MNNLPHVAKAEALVKAALSEIDALIVQTSGEQQRQASHVGSFLHETAAALRIAAGSQSTAELLGNFNASISPRPGDPARDSLTRVNVFLDQAETDLAYTLGSGNISDGIRKALQHRL